MYENCKNLRKCQKLSLNVLWTVVAIISFLKEKIVCEKKNTNIDYIEDSKYE